MVFAEKQVIEGCLKGDRLSQQTLYNRYAGKMLAICKRYLRDMEHAEDAFQDAFVKVFLHLKNFTFQSTLDTWITRIFINEAINKLRNLKRLALQVSIDETTWQMPDAIENTPDKFDSEMVLMLMNKLPENYSIVLMLFAIDGYSHKEIAEKLSMPESTSRSTLTRARSMLWQLYKIEIKSHESRRV
ncbi:MAG: RNA polymerase sigma factor [Bacteroidetes bacterium]|nr:RNA polymerase sigma factor [Bacteroidota bacterium]